MRRRTQHTTAKGNVTLNITITHSDLDDQVSNAGAEAVLKGKGNYRIMVALDPESPLGTTISAPVAPKGYRAQVRAPVHLKDQPRPINARLTRCLLSSTARGRRCR